MPTAPDHRGTQTPIPVPEIWDYHRLKRLAFTNYADMLPGENAYLTTWLQTTDRDVVMARLTEWEAEAR